MAGDFFSQVKYIIRYVNSSFHNWSIINIRKNVKKKFPGLPDINLNDNENILSIDKNIIDNDKKFIVRDGNSIPVDGFSIHRDGFPIPGDGIPIPKDGFSISNDNFIVDENELFIVDDFVNVDLYRLDKLPRFCSLKLPPLNILVVGTFLL